MPASPPPLPAESDDLRFITDLLGDDGTFFIRPLPDGRVAITYRRETGTGWTRAEAIRDLAVRLGIWSLID